MADPNRVLLESIDAKLGGILVLLVDLYLRETGVAKPRPRSIDKALSDVGLSSAQIAALLGKTERAVQKQLSEKKAK
jgi:hypothetical protein